MKIIRVFPRKTSATPNDQDVRIDCEPGLFDECDKVHISVVFTWDLKRAEELEKAWSNVAPVYMGGPAFGYNKFLPSGDFTPGLYVKNGYTITSRGCPNRCWFCSVWKREGGIRELPIHAGSNLLDDNILACSDQHINAVFDMAEKNKPFQFTGGLEAKLLKRWHVERLAKIKPSQIFFAYDTPDDLEPLIQAGKLLKEYGFSFRQLRCHVLMGCPNDTIEKAEKRLWQTVDAGFMPSAMVYRDQSGKKNTEWSKFQRAWQRPVLIMRTIKTATQTKLGGKSLQPTTTVL